MKSFEKFLVGSQCWIYGVFKTYKYNNNPSQCSNNNSNSSNGSKGQITMCPNADVQNTSQVQRLACFPAHFPPLQSAAELERSQCRCWGKEDCASTSLSLLIRPEVEQLQRESSIMFSARNCGRWATAFKPCNNHRREKRDRQKARKHAGFGTKTIQT